MSNRLLNVARSTLFWQRLFAVVFTSTLLVPNFGSEPARAQVTEYCQLSSATVQEKENLRLSALKGNQEAQHSTKTGRGIAGMPDSDLASSPSYLVALVSL